MKKIFIGMIVTIMLIMLVSCAPSPEAIQKAMEQTQSAMPTQTAIPTPTLIPLSEIDLESVLIQPNDLPTGFTSGQVREIDVNFRDLMNIGVNSILQDIENEGSDKGEVVVLLYDDLNDVNTQYHLIVDQYGPNETTGTYAKDLYSRTKAPIPDLGEESMYIDLGLSNAFVNTHVIETTFTRCHALVTIRIFDASLEDTIIYSKRLDKRLSELVCR